MRRPLISLVIGFALIAPAAAQAPTFQSLTVTGPTTLLGSVTPTGASVRQQGAVCDVTYYTGGTATAGSTAYNAGAAIPATDASHTHRIVIGGAGPNGTPLVTTYTADGSSTVTLGTSASLSTGSSISYPVISHMVAAGGGYAPGDTIDLAGGTFTQRGRLTVRSTALTGTPTVAAGGSGAIQTGAATVVGTTGSGIRFILAGTIAGGALSAITSVYYAGRYTTNPTSLAAEPVSIYLGPPGNGMGVPAASGITGATVNLTSLMGVWRADVTTPGNYTAVPVSPVSQSASSGAGTGATFTIGASTATMFTTGTDDTAALQAIASDSTKSAAAFPTDHRCGISNTVTMNTNFARLGSLAGGPETLSGLPVNTRSPLSTVVDTPTPGLAWFGAPGGIMVQIVPPASGSPLITGTVVEGLDFQGHGIAGVGLLTAGNHGGNYQRLNFADFTDAAVDVSATPTASSQHNRYAIIRGDQQRGTGSIMRLRQQSVGVGGNPSFNIFENISGIMADADGIDCVNSDNNTFTNTHMYQITGGNGISFNAHGAPVTNGCRANRFMGFSGAGGMVFQGLESDGSASILNTIIGGPDIANADPQPIYGVSAQAIAVGSNGRVYGFQSSNAVFAKEIDLGKAAAMSADPQFGSPTVYGTFSFIQGNQAGPTRCNFSIDASQHLQIVPSANCTYLDMINMGTQFGSRVVTAAGAVATTFKDWNICLAKTVSAPTTVNLMASPIVGQQLTVSDCKGDAAANNITILPNAGNVDGSANYVIASNFGSWTGVYNGTIWKTVGAGQTASSGSAGGPHPGYIVNNWYSPVGYNAAAATPVLNGANSVTCSFGIVPQSVTASTLGGRITTLAAGGNVQFAVYTNGAWGRPSTLVAATGNISTAAAGAVNGVASAPLPAGNYWFCQNADNATVVLTAQGGSTASPYVGSAAQGSAGTGPALPILGVSTAQTFGTWPSFTSGTVWGEITTAIAPYLLFKVASSP